MSSSGNDGKAGRKVRIVYSAELTAKASATLRQWHRSRGAVLNCPNCGAPGLTIVDRSTRPIAEWYAFRCEACGLDDTLSLAMTIHRPLL